MKTKTLTPKEALDSTKRIQYVNDEVVKSIPEGTGSEITFFKLDRYVTCQELDNEYKKRGLIASPIDICAYDVKNPEKMDEMKYVGTQWKDADGNWCFATFLRFFGKRFVIVFRVDSDWDVSWWFAGVPAPVAVESAKFSGAKDSSVPQPFELPEVLVINGAKYQKV